MDVPATSPKGECLVIVPIPRTLLYMYLRIVLHPFERQGQGQTDVHGGDATARVFPEYDMDTCWI